MKETVKISLARKVLKYIMLKILKAICAWIIKRFNQSASKIRGIIKINKEKGAQTALYQAAQRLKRKL